MEGKHLKYNYETHKHTKNTKKVCKNEKERLI